jgi:hypothetical protein
MAETEQQFGPDFVKLKNVAVGTIDAGLNELTLTGAFSPKDVETDIALGHTFHVLLTDDITLKTPKTSTGIFIPGQVVTWFLEQDIVGGHIITFESVFRFSTTLPSITLSTAATYLDVLSAKCLDASGNKWLVLGFAKGFT